MASDREIRKRFNDFAGLDLRSGDLVREREYSPELVNVEIAKSIDRNLEKRVGGKMVSDDTAPYLGLATYQYLDLNGQAQQELVGIDEHLRRRLTSTFTITYSGAGSSATASLLFDATEEEFVLTLDVDGVETTHLLGTGLEAVPVTLANLKTAIELDADFAVVISGGTSVPAAMLQLIESEDCVAGAALTYHEWEQINHTWGATPPFNTYEARKFESYFEPADMKNFNQSLLIATGYEYLHRYDGQTLFRAGLPRPTTPTAATAGAGAITDTEVEYFITYEQKDNQGIFDESRRSEFTTQIAALAAENVNVTVPNIVAGTGFNTNCAQVNGVQAGVTTITVDAGHTLKVGDTAYFYDGVSAAYVEREVTGIGATTITIAGANVNVADNLPISNNLRIRIWRNTAGGLDYYLVHELANNSLTATQVYLDSMTPATLVARERWVEPIFPPDLLDAKPKYIAVHPHGPLCVAGDPAYPNTVFFSEMAFSTFGFPAATHSFLVNSKIASGITGLFPAMDELVIFKDRGVYFQYGDLASLAFSIRKEHEGQIGAASHASIVEHGGDIHFLSYEGPRRLIGGTSLETGPDGRPAASRIDPLFRTRETAEDMRLKLKRSIGFVDSRGGRALWFIPTEDETNGDIYPNGNSKVVVYDYEQDAWFSHQNFDFSAGIADYDDNIWYAAKAYDSGAGTLYAYLWRRHDLRNGNDYNDHHEGIAWRFVSQWDDGGNPDDLMLVDVLRVYSQGRTSAVFMLDFSTEIDYLDSIAHSFGELDFGGDAGGYGVGPYGQDIYGAPGVDEVVTTLSLDDHVKSIRFIFENEAYNENVTLSGYSYSLAFPYRRKIRGS